MMVETVATSHTVEVAAANSILLPTTNNQSKLTKFIELTVQAIPKWCG